MDHEVYLRLLEEQIQCLKDMHGTTMSLHEQLVKWTNQSFNESLDEEWIGTEERDHYYERIVQIEEQISKASADYTAHEGMQIKLKAKQEWIDNIIQMDAMVSQQFLFYQQSSEGKMLVSRQLNEATKHYGQRAIYSAAFIDEKQ